MRSQDISGAVCYTGIVTSWNRPDMSHGDQWLSVATKTKINAWLRVMPRQREASLHELESLFLPLAYGDQLSLSARPSRKAQVLLSSNRRDLLPDNSVQTAWHVFSDALTSREKLIPYEISAYLTKRIPEQTGLGAGSGDAGAALLAFNQLYGLPFEQSELVQLACQIGSDVSFFVRAEASLVQGKGDTSKAIPALPPLWCCIAIPDFRINTAQAYAALDRIMAKQGVSTVDPTVDLASVILALRTRTRLTGLGRERLNSFEAVLDQNTAVFLNIRDSLIDNDAILAGLSGSGSAVFGLYAEKAAAEAAAFGVRGCHGIDRTFVAEVL